MDIKYTIVNLYRDVGKILIKYYTDEFLEGFLFELDLPINVETNTTISVEELDELIMFNAPRMQLADIVEKKRLAALVDYSHIEALVETPVPVSIEDMQTPAITTDSASG